MKIARKKIHAIYMILLLMTAGLGYGGYFYGIGLAKILLNGWVNEQADDVTKRIELLRQLRSGKEADTVELLESQLDADLIVLEPEPEISIPLDNDIQSKMYDALRDAQQYRKDYPRTSHQSIDNMVNNVLSRSYPK